MSRVRWFAIFASVLVVTSGVFAVLGDWGAAQYLVTLAVVLLLAEAVLTP
jgi:hypothetical protein